jgi:hypothetical protein
MTIQRYESVFESWEPVSLSLDLSQHDTAGGVAKQIPASRWFRRLSLTQIEIAR